MGRATCWIAEDGDSATQIANAISPYFAPVVYKGLLDHIGDDMKVGVEVEHLSRDSEMLKSLIMLDPRGGIFSHADMQQALCGAHMRNAGTLLIDLLKREFKDRCVVQFWVEGECVTKHDHAFCV